MCIDALVQDTAAKIKICRYSYAPFLKSTSISGPSAQNYISEIYDHRTVYPKGFLVLGQFQSLDRITLSWTTIASYSQIFFLSSGFSLLHKADALADGGMNW